MNTENFKFVVVGTGLSGAVIAERISNILNEKVLVLEKQNHIGGNAYDFSKDGITIQKYGPHIFHTNSEKAWNYISQFTEWIPYKHKVLAFINGKLVPLPFNFSAIEILFDKEKAKAFEKVLTETFRFGTSISVIELIKSENPELKELANFIYENVFLNYTIKQWGISPEKIDKNVLSRVPINISYEDTYFKDKFQGIPKNGFTHIFEKMLPNKIHLEKNTGFFDIFKIDVSKGKIFLKNGKEFKGVLVYTGRTDELFGFKFGKLGYRSLEFEFEKYNKEFFQKVAVVNYPNDFEFTRISEFKHLYRSKTKFTIIAKEFPKAFFEGNIPYYPILSDENKRLFSKYENEAKKIKNLILLGRLANFKYINMDEAVLNALSTFEQIVSKSLKH